MSDGFWTGAIVAGLLAAGIYYTTDAPQTESQEPVAGRYQIVTGKDAPNFLLDTATGDTWRWVHINSDYKKTSYGMPETLGFIWEKQTRFTDETEETKYIVNVKEFDRTLNGPKPKK